MFVHYAIGNVRASWGFSPEGPFDFRSGRPLLGNKNPAALGGTTSVQKDGRILTALAFGIKDGVTHAGCGVREETTVTSEKEYTLGLRGCQGLVPSVGLEPTWVAPSRHMAGLARPENYGAEGETRTPNPLQGHGSKPCAYTSSATSANYLRYILIEHPAGGLPISPRRHV